MKRLTMLIMVSLLSLGAMSTAHAGLGIGARYSYVHNNDLEDNSTMAGAMIRIRHLTFFGLEGAADFRNEELNNGWELRSTPITVSAMIYPIPVVYGLAGIGLYRATLDVGDELVDTRLGYHFGAGIETPLLPPLKFTSDIRYQFVDYEFSDHGDLRQVEADGYAISAGLVLYLK